MDVIYKNSFVCRSYARCREFYSRSVRGSFTAALLLREGNRRAAAGSVALRLPASLWRLLTILWRWMAALPATRLFPAGFAAGLVTGSRSAAWMRGSMFGPAVLDRPERAALGLIVFAFPFIPVTATFGLVLFLTLIFALRGRFNGAFSLPLAPQATVFLLLLLLYSFFSVTLRESLQATVIFIAFFLFYLMAVIELDSRRKIYTVTVIFLLSATLEALAGLYQNFISRPPAELSWVDAGLFPEITVRVFGTLDNPNILAQYLVPAIILGGGMVWQVKGIAGKTFFAGQVALMAASLVFTYSRGGWLALILAVLLFGLLRDRRFLLLAGALLAGAFWLQQDLIASRLSSVGNLEETSTSYRTFIWQTAYRIISDFWAGGVGTGTAAFREVYNKFYMVTGVTAFHAHNLYIELMVETGLFGLLGFLWLVLSYFSHGLKRLIQLPAFEKTVLSAALAGMAGYLAHGLTENSWYNFKLALFFWWLLALGVSAARLKSAEN